MDFPRLFYHTILEGMGDVIIKFSEQLSDAAYDELVGKQAIPNDRDKFLFDWNRRNYEAFYSHANTCVDE